jgi:predicted RNA-binding Zn-ribbon protein involved in translation (DUF1610 family)
MGGWQDIATAPRDGTWILLYARNWGKPVVGIWDRQRQFWAEGYHGLDRPTHWMPLPDLPFRRCVGCGATLEITHRRQQYCTPQCSQRTRFRRWAARRGEDGTHG